MPAGRPRTTTPPKKELIELGEELVKWATEETKEIRIRYCEWYNLVKGITKKEWEMMLEKPEFQCYYEKARTALAKRWIDGTVNSSIAHRFLRIYCPEVKRDEEEKLEYEAKIAQKTQLPQNDELSSERIKNAKLMAENAELKALNGCKPQASSVDLPSQ